MWCAGRHYARCIRALWSIDGRVNGTPQVIASQFNCEPGVNAKNQAKRLA